MVGPWQVPVADVAVTLADFDGFAGEAMSSGERFPLAGVDAPASGRMAVGEALTNLLAAPVTLDRVKLSCNWMAACGEPGEDAALYDTVRAVGLQLCPQLGIGVPVGKDSLSMRTRWSQDGSEHEVISPVSLLVSAFAQLPDVRGTLTPQLRGGGLRSCSSTSEPGRTGWAARSSPRSSGGSAAGCPTSTTRAPCGPCMPRSASCGTRGLLTAYHDRSDGGLWATVCEMGFAGRQGVRLDLAGLVGDGDSGRRRRGPCSPRSSASSSRWRHEHVDEVLGVLGRARARASVAHVVGHTGGDPSIDVALGGEVLVRGSLRELQQAWDEVSWRIAALRDNPDCADEEHAAAGDEADPGLHVAAHLRPDATTSPAPFVSVGSPQGRGAARAGRQQPRRDQLRPRPRRLRHLRRAHDRPADRAGDASRHTRGSSRAAGSATATRSGPARAGRARSCSTRPCVEQFSEFFARDDTFALGICNGAQVMAALADLIPGAQDWPTFTRNRSEQFEARLSLVEVLDSPAVVFAGMAGSRLPIAVAHGEGYADFSRRGNPAAVHRAMRFVDNHGRPGRPLPGQPQRQPRRAHRGHHCRRAVHRADAPPRAGAAQRPDELDQRRGLRAQPMAADVPQRARLRGLSSDRDRPRARPDWGSSPTSCGARATPIARDTQNRPCRPAHLMLNLGRRRPATASRRTSGRRRSTRNQPMTR